MGWNRRFALEMKSSRMQLKVNNEDLLCSDAVDFRIGVNSCKKKKKLIQIKNFAFNKIAALQCSILSPKNVKNVDTPNINQIQLFVCLYIYNTKSKMPLFSNVILSIYCVILMKRASDAEAGCALHFRMAIWSFD